MPIDASALRFGCSGDTGRIAADEGRGADMHAAVDRGCGCDVAMIARSSISCSIKRLLLMMQFRPTTAPAFTIAPCMTMVPAATQRMPET